MQSICALNNILVFTKSFSHFFSDKRPQTKQRVRVAVGTTVTYLSPFLAKRNRVGCLEKWLISGPGQEMHRKNLGHLVIQKARALLAANGLC